MKWFKKRDNLLNKTNQLPDFIIPAKLVPIYQALINNFNQRTSVQINKIFITGTKGSGKSAFAKQLINDLNRSTLIGHGYDLKRFEQCFSRFNQPKHLLIIDQVDWQGRAKKQIKSYLDALNNQALLVVIANQPSKENQNNCDAQIDFDLVLNLDWYYQSSDLIKVIDQANAKQIINASDCNLLKKIVNDPGLNQSVLMWEVIKVLKQVHLFANANQPSGPIYRDLLMKKLETDRMKELGRHLEYTMVSYGSNQCYYDESEQNLIYVYNDE